MNAMRIVAVLGAVTLIAGCKAREARQGAAESATAEDAHGALTLETYEVPGQHARQIRSILRHVFRAGGDKSPIASAEITPDGQLLVLGVPGVQKGVAELVAKMATRKAPPPPPTVEISYWLVIGQAADKTSFGTGLDEVAPALEAIAGNQGAMRFDRLEHVKLRSLTDERGRAQGRFTEVNQRASLHQGKILANVKIEIIGGSRLETQLSLAPDKFLVLGEAGLNIRPLNLAPTQGEGPHTLLYVVRAVVRDAR